MSPVDPPETERERELRRELKLAYEQMTAITSRLLLASEAAEAALTGDDPATISERFLQTAARGMEVRRAAMFLADGDDFSVGATFGMRPEEAEAVAENDAELAACRAAVTARDIHVVDDHLVAGDVREGLAAGAAARAVETGSDDEDEGSEEDEEETGEADASDEGNEELEDEGEEAADATGADDDEDGDEDGDQEEADEEDDDEADDGPPGFGVYIPVGLAGEAVAVLALGERAGGAVYRYEDLVFLRYLLRQFALTLHRSSLLQRDEERLEELDALLKVSREITSTLDLDAVLRSVVNTVSAVVPNDRAEIALMRGGKLVLRAVSGMTRLDPDQVEIFKLAAPLEYLRANPRRLHIGAGDLGDEGAPAGHDVFEEYFSAQQMRSFMALPLRDDQGLLGFLCIESRQEAWDVDPAEGDTLSILAAQTTVAIRNATLYSEIPLRGVALPVSRVGAWLGGLNARGRVVAGTLLAAALVALALPITPERAGGLAEVRPLRYQGVRALTEGVVHSVSVTGGEEVRRGETLAVVEDLDLAGRLAELRAQIEGARRDMATARLAGDVAGWRAHEIKLAGLEGTLAVEERRARGRTLTAPFGGQVLELDLAQRVGQHLEAGESFCTVAALHRMAVDFSVSEDKIGRVRLGQAVAVKVKSFPTRTFRGRVSEVGWRGHTDAGGNTSFVVRAEVDNLDRTLRPGMTGVAKASVGRRSAAELALAPLLRNLSMRLW
jgi:multidrug efflux pump subunit AcrA (membrane-fusion protein)